MTNMAISKGGTKATDFNIYKNSNVMHLACSHIYEKSAFASPVSQVAIQRSKLRGGSGGQAGRQPKKSSHISSGSFNKTRNWHHKTSSSTYDTRRGTGRIRNHTSIRGGWVLCFGLLLSSMWGCLVAGVGKQAATPMVHTDKATSRCTQIYSAK